MPGYPWLSDKGCKVKRGCLTRVASYPWLSDKGCRLSLVILQGVPGYHWLPGKGYNVILGSLVKGTAISLVVRQRVQDEVFNNASVEKLIDRLVLL